MDNAAETLSSLRFGVRARGIVNSVQLNAAKLLKTPLQIEAARHMEVSRLALMSCLVGLVLLTILRLLICLGHNS